MGDVERIITIERHAYQRGYLRGIEEGKEDGAKAERVRVVEGLVATIKALPQHDAGHETYSARPIPAVRLTDVLAVVEAAREDTT